MQTGAVIARLLLSLLTRRTAAVAKRASCALAGWAAGAEYAAAAQLVEVRKTDAGQLVEEVGLGGMDAVGDLRSRTEGAACGHAVIVRLGGAAAVAP
ncbi:hypothetical protein [Streptomyces sp. NPDC059071]|uniref:hypothetical protein n=1 Tax=unclassified Streptomyces TaxID=2593676 RepID=UPI00365362E3